MYFLNKLKTLLVFIFIFLLAILSGFVIYQLMPNINFSVYLNNERPTFKILLSNNTLNILKLKNLNPQKYKNDIVKLALRLKQNGFNYKIISEKDLIFLNKNDILISPDTYAISTFAKNEIKNFLAKGGTFVFNFRFGYFDENQHFLNAKTIEEITNLKKKIEAIPKNKAIFYIHKRISPLNMSDNPTREDLVIYDSLPIFHSNFIPDIVLTNWSVTSSPQIQNHNLSIYDDGIAWHGFYGKGKWFYFSFPAYVFLDMNDKEFKKIFSNIASYSNNLISISSYPFLDKPNAVFISEDTEYKYPYGYNFAKLANEYNIDVTLFAVAKLAKKYENITKAIAQFKNCEIGSHSYSHSKILGAPIEVLKQEIIYSKKLLEKITGRKIYGFRPPREEIDDRIEKMLKEAGYIYVMEKPKPFLLPFTKKYGIITIPRHGTDDYTYLIDTDFNKSQIFHNIILENNFVTALNGVYTLSVHTHLLAYKTNISVLEKYFKYLQNKYFYPMKGKDIATKALLAQNISYDYSASSNIITLNISNNNNQEVKNLTFRIYTPTIKIINFTPEIDKYNVKIVSQNKLKRFYDVQINKIPPKTTIVIFIKYKRL